MECIGYTLSTKVISSLVNLTLFITLFIFTMLFDYILAQIEHLIYKPNTKNVSLPLPTALLLFLPVDQ